MDRANALVQLDRLCRTLRMPLYSQLLAEAEAPFEDMPTVLETLQRLPKDKRVAHVLKLYSKGMRQLRRAKGTNS